MEVNQNKFHFYLSTFTLNINFIFPGVCTREDTYVFIYYEENQPFQNLCKSGRNV